MGLDLPGQRTNEIIDLPVQRMDELDLPGQRKDELRSFWPAETNTPFSIS